MVHNTHHTNTPSSFQYKAAANAFGKQRVALSGKVLRVNGLIHDTH